MDHLLVEMELRLYDDIIRAHVWENEWGELVIRALMKQQPGWKGNMVLVSYVSPGLLEDSVAMHSYLVSAAQTEVQIDAEACQ